MVYPDHWNWKLINRIRFAFNKLFRNFSMVKISSSVLFLQLCMPYIYNVLYIFFLNRIANPIPIHTAILFEVTRYWVNAKNVIFVNLAATQDCQTLYSNSRLYYSELYNIVRQEVCFDFEIYLTHYQSSLVLVGGKERHYYLKHRQSSHKQA